MRIRLAPSNATGRNQPMRHAPVRQPRRKPLAVAILQTLAAGALVVDASPVNAAPALALPQPEAVLASMGVAGYSVNGLKGIVDQQSDRAILNWKSFDIGAQNSVEFRQPSATSVALNRINERVNPSQILGTLTANGQVYLFNPNGFLFGASARVDVNSLVASTLNVTDEILEKGITNAIADSKPAFVGNGELYLRDETGAYRRDAGGNRIKITTVIEDGAVISTNAANGRILVLAPSIVNNGALSASEGQVILAAATDKVYLQAADSTTTGIRGLLVEVGTGGDVTNFGKIIAERGNVTLAGFAVNQNGLVSATTSVDLNGSIVLKAAEGAAIDTSSGAPKLVPGSTARAQASDDGLGMVATVTLGPGSITRVLPETDSARTAVDEQAQDFSRIDILGKSVRLRGGSQIKAPGGRVAIRATEHPANAALDTDFSADTGIELEAGSSIDVAGSSASASVSRNVVDVQLLSNELRDAPEQKSGPLFGKKIRVDIRTGTPLADISGAVARIERGVGERTSAGGSITLQSSGRVVVDKGSLLDVSGGLLNYLSGYIDTTTLIGADGAIYAISQADPQRAYVGILGEVSKTYAKWNVTKTWSIAPLLAQGRYEPGYVEGKAGGQLNILAPLIALQGDIRGTTVDGDKQRDAADRAAGATLLIDQSKFSSSQSVVIVDENTAALLAGLNSTLALVDARLAQSGFRNVTLKTGSTAEVARDATLNLGRGGTLNISAASATIAGNIDSIGGKVTIDTTGGNLVLANGARIDVRGEWTNDRIEPQVGPVHIDGGAVTLRARGELILSSGSAIDVSGGAWLRSDGALQDGKGGSISLRADPDTPAPIKLEGSLRGAGLKRGGQLALTANRVELIAGNTQPTPDLTALLLTPEFFQSGGFANYVITADRDGLLVRENALIQPRAGNFVLRDGYLTTMSARGLGDIAMLSVLPDVERAAANLTLAVNHTGIGADPDAALRMAKGSVIRTDVGGSVTLSSDSDLLVSGEISAPAGNINLRVTAPPTKNLAGFDITDPGYRPNQGIWLDATGVLSAKGVATHRPNALGTSLGEVLAGGIVRLTADRGYIVLQENSRIDVSGTAGTYSQAGLDTRGIGTVYTDTVLGSSGGTIALTAADGALLNGALSARPGAGPGAGGGTLALMLTTQNRSDDLRPYPNAPSVIALSATPAAAFSTAFGGSVPFEHYGVASLSAAQIHAGGFSALDLAVDGISGNAVRLLGDVDLHLEKRITLNTPTIEAGSSAGISNLRAAYVGLGSNQLRGAVAGAGGNGALAVRADLIDLIGGLGTQGFDVIDLISAGDIRFRGIAKVGASDLTGQFVSAADLRFHAAQLYPTTFSQYEVALSGDAQGVLSIAAGGVPHPVLSAGGKLAFAAPYIVQAGVIKAPFGTLALNASETLTLAPGSITSVSAEGQIIPFGKTLAGLEWIYDLSVDATGGYKPVQASAPAKRIALNGKSVLFESGATLDVSGGGDLQAYEFIKGPGGSADVLDPRDPTYAAGGYSEKYALLPALQGEFAPYDYAEFSQSGLQIGDSIYLSGGQNLPAGTYVLLPAHYALLPGAYLVTPQSAPSMLTPTSGGHTINGAEIVSGYRLSAGTQIHDSSWSRFAIEPGSIARTRSQYTLARASEFFPAKVDSTQSALLNLPADAGTVALSAQTALTLRGHINADAVGNGRRGQLDVVADDIVIAKRGDATRSDVIELFDDELNALGVGSLFIGGTRAHTASGELLTIGARDIEVAAGAMLSAPEILLGATRRVAVGEGAIVNAQGSGATADALGVQGDAALLRVSSAGLAAIEHTGTIAGNAQLSVAAGAVLRSSGSVNLDSTGGGSFFGTLDMPAGALEIGAQRIVLGNADGAAGFVLNKALLNALRVDALSLNSHSQIDLFGDFDLAVKNLSVQAAGFNGHGGINTIRADRVVLANPGAVSGSFGGAAGQLRIDSGQLVLGGGDFSLAGFNGSDFSARQGIRLEDDGRLISGGDIILRAPVINSAAGVSYAISAQRGAEYYNVDVLPLAASGAQSLAGLGAQLRIDGKRIAIGSGADAVGIVLPSGSVALRAHGGDVLLTSGATVDVSGRQQVFADKWVFSGGGSVDLSADGGDVEALPGSLIDVSAPAAGGDAGVLSASAPGGSVRLNGALSAHAGTGYAGGSVAVDIGHLESGAWSALNALFSGAGFSESIAWRQRVGDLLVDIGDTVRARAVKLVADLGAIRVAGTLDASGASAGRVTLAGGAGVTLASTASILARASADNEKGGHVLIDSVGGIGSAGGDIDLQAGSLIDVRGGKVVENTTSNAIGTLVYAVDGARVDQGGVQYRGGDVVLRAPRTASSLRANNAGVIRGADRVTAEAVRVYDLGDDGVIDAAKIAGYRSDTSAFFDSAVAPGGNIDVIAGIELRAAHSLTLSSAWDLVDWRFGSVPGALTLRSGGDLVIDASLSDAFKAQTLQLPDGAGGTFSLTLNNTLQEGNSWSYRLIGGGDLGSADVLARRVADAGAAGNIALRNGAFVRTGTGSIDIAAAGNLTLADDRSAIYTAGRKADASAQLDADNPYGTLGSLLKQFYAEFPLDGGDIAIDVGGDVIGATQSTNVYRAVGGSRNVTATTHQFITDWWVKAGSNLGYTGWGIALDVPSELLTLGSTAGGVQVQQILNARSGFRQNIGALGGGDVSIKAGGDITDLSVMIPTTGKPIGARDPVSGSNFLSRDVLINGGGNLKVAAGGNVSGGVFFVGAGSADIRAGGNIQGGSQYQAGPEFALGNTALRITAAGGIDIGSIFDPGLLSPVYSTRAESYFLTYGERSAVDITALSGDIVLHNDTVELLANTLRYTLRPTDTVVKAQTYLKYTDFLALYPARLSARALSGDIDLLRSFTLAPDANGTLELLAANTIQSGGALGANVDVNLSDGDIGKLPSILRPGALGNAAGLLLINDVNTGLSHAATPVHQFDTEPAYIVALNGDIRTDGWLRFGLSKAAVIEAGRDIVNIGFDLQNLRGDDVTTLRAGRDIFYSIDFNANSGVLSPLDQSIYLSGPGRFEFSAGRDIDLGASNGIASVGNLRNAALPDEGASLGIYAGVGTDDYRQFIQRYLESGDLYTQALLDYVNARAEAQVDSKAAALLVFDSLPLAQQRKLLVDVLFDELRASGIAAAQQNDRGLLQRGLDAIGKFFSSDNLRGNLKLFLSKISTAAGGDIDILVPAGFTNVGLASSGLSNKAASELGIVAQTSGAINVFVKDGLQVNQSRLFALGGGDITVWSTDGDIDAGRGSKAALSAPAPVVRFDERGNLRVTYPPSVSGSGIRTAAPPNLSFGDVYLFTVNGVINVGEAGIAGSHLTVVGPIVDPGGGLDFGSTVGTPAATVSLSPALAGVGNQLAGASQSISDNLVAREARQNSAPAVTSFLTAQLIGFGDYSVSAVREGNFSGGEAAGTRSSAVDSVRDGSVSKGGKSTE